MKLFTEQQYRGLLILVPVAVVLVAISVALELLRPAEQTEVKEEWLKPAKGSQMVEENDAEIELKPFDPNTYSYEQLRAAGLRKEIAVSIVRWRSRPSSCWRHSRWQAPSCGPQAAPAYLPARGA